MRAILGTTCPALPPPVNKIFFIRLCTVLSVSFTIIIDGVGRGYSFFGGEIRLSQMKSFYDEILPCRGVLRLKKRTNFRPHNFSVYCTFLEFFQDFTTLKRALAESAFGAKYPYHVCDEQSLESAFFVEKGV